MLGIRVLVGCVACLSVPQQERPEFTLGQKNSSVSWSGLCVRSRIPAANCYLLSNSLGGESTSTRMVAPYLTLHLTHFIHFQCNIQERYLEEYLYIFFSLDWDVSLTRRRVWLRETVSASVIFQQHSVYVRTSLCGSLIKAQQWVLIKRIGLLWLIPCVTCNVFNSMNHRALYMHAKVFTPTRTHTHL